MGWGGERVSHVNSRTFCATTTKPRRAENRYRSFALLLPVARQPPFCFVGSLRPDPMRCDAMRVSLSTRVDDWFQRKRGVGGGEGSPNRKLLMPRERSPITSKLSTTPRFYQSFPCHVTRTDSRPAFEKSLESVLRGIFHSPLAILIVRFVTRDNRSCEF